jgi:hypothetical protein
MSHLYGDGRLNSQTLNVNLTMVGDLCPPQAKLREWRRAPAPTRFRYTNARIEKPRPRSTGLLRFHGGGTSGGGTATSTNRKSLGFVSSIALKSTLMKALAIQSGFSAMPTSVTTELATKDCGYQSRQGVTIAGGATYKSLKHR